MEQGVVYEGDMLLLIRSKNNLKKEEAFRRRGKKLGLHKNKIYGNEKIEKNQNVKFIINKSTINPKGENEKKRFLMGSRFKNRKLVQISESPNL